MTDFPETELISLAHDGNVEAFGALIRRHEKSLTAYVRGKVHNWADAQDIVQDTFIAALRGFDGFDVRRPFRPWLKAICRNRLIRHYRGWTKHGKNSVSLSDEQTACRVAAMVSDEADDGDGEYISYVVRRCLTKVNRRHADLLWLRHGEDLSLDEVARRSGRTPHCLAQTLYRARQRLRRAIELRLKSGIPDLPSFLDADDPCAA